MNDWKALPKTEVQRLFDALEREAGPITGPTVRDGAIVLDHLSRAEQLPIGVHDVQAPGSYRLETRNDGKLFGYVVGPQSFKQVLFPAKEILYRAARRPDGKLGFAPVETAAKGQTFFGVRSCELVAMQIQDRVFRETHAAKTHADGVDVSTSDVRYRARRERAFVVAVDCMEPGGLCFCVSAGAGPAVGEGADVVLAELSDVLLARAGSERGKALLDGLSLRSATEQECASRTSGLQHAEQSMGRSMDFSSVPGKLLSQPEHPRWKDVAARCVSCGNCTAVCPTCFCWDAQEHSSLDGTSTERTRTWTSCFTAEHALMHGHDGRGSTKDRYRQWLTHKFDGWVEQFGSSGCTGCGRCIAWCPSGIDVVEEVKAIASTAKATVTMPSRPSGVVTDVAHDALVPRSVEVKAVRRETHDVMTLELDVGADAKRCLPGRFAMLSLPGIGECAISFSGSEGTIVEHTIRSVGATTKALTELRVGASVGWRGPYGNDWPYELAEQRSLTVLAGGIGLAPLRGVVRAALDEPERFPKVQVLYGARAPEELLYPTELLGWASQETCKLLVTVDRAGRSWRGEVGVVTRLLEHVPLSVDGLYLLCGPEVMMRFVAKALLAAKVPANRMYLSMERHMKCGVGQCGRCQYGPHFLCVDGPILRYDVIASLLGIDGL